METNESRSTIWAVLGSLAALGVAMALTPWRDSVATADIALVLVLVVVLAAVNGGRMAGMVTAVTAALSFDFFHTAPYQRLTIDTRQDVVTTLLLLAVGVVVGHVAARGRHARTSVAQAGIEVRSVHRVAELAAHAPTADDIVRGAEDALRTVLHLRECRFESAPFDSRGLDDPPYVRLEHTGAIDSHMHRYTDGGFELPVAGVTLDVVHRTEVFGRFVLVPTPRTGATIEERMLAVAVADQVASALAAREREPGSPSA